MARNTRQSWVSGVTRCSRGSSRPFRSGQPGLPSVSLLSWWPLRPLGSLHPGKPDDTLQAREAPFALLSLHSMTVTLPTARASTTTLRSGPAALLVEQEGGGQQQQPEAEPGPHGGAPGAAGTGGDPRGTAAGARGAAAGGSAAEGRGASAAHRPGRGGSRRRPERGPASSPICWRCPLPSAARGRRLKGEDPAARVRGGGSARPGDCGRRAPGRQGSALRTHPRQPRDPAPPAPVHRPEDRGLRPAPGGPRGRSRCPCAASGRPRSGGCARTAPDAGPETRRTARSPEWPDREHGQTPVLGVQPCPAAVAAAGGCDRGATGPERPGGREEV